MKNPLVPWTCGSVSRNSGRDGCAKAGHSSPSGRTAQAARVDDRLALVRVQGADRVEDRAAGAHALGGGAEERELEVWQRASRASGGRAAGRGRRAPSTARPRGLGRSRRAPAAVAVPSASTTVTSERPILARFSRSSRARAGSISTAVTSPRSCPVLPPGAAQRSSTRSPSCEPTQRPASCEPRLWGQILPLCHQPLDHALDAVRAGDVGLLRSDRRLRRARAGRPSRAARSSRASARARRPPRAPGRRPRGSSRDRTPSTARPAATRAAAGSRRRAAA